jgi:hypothetical protein
LDNPLTSVSRIILSDIITSQIHSKQRGLPIIITTKIFIEDISLKKYSYLELNQEGINHIKSLFVGLKGLTAKEKNERMEHFRKSILINEDNFCSKYLVNWSGEDEATDGREYKARKEKLRKKFNIPFDNTQLGGVNEDEKLNYVIKIEHELHPSTNEKLLTKKNVENFLAKISVLALHTRRNKKNFADVERQATKSAISQVMARNMSHNIGSHVMNRLTDGKKLEDLDINNFKSYQPAFDLPSDEQKIIHQMSFFNNYVKCRMDYLSDITFGTPVMHTNKKVCGELFKEFDRVRLLLEFISGLSTFEYEIQFMFNGRLMCRDTDDISIALPNDLLGCQAFYNILENIIRNTAKHNPKKNQKTVFTVDVKEIESTIEGNGVDQGVLSEQSKMFYAVEIYDDCVIGGYDIFPKEEQLVEGVHDYTRSNSHPLFVEGKNVSNIDWLVYKQNKKINQSVLQQRTYKLRTSFLGLMEMEASAAYLRKLDIVEIENEDYSVEYNGSLSNSSSKKFNILKAINKDGKLGYRFFVSRPTEILFIGDYSAEVDVNSLLKIGIWFRSENSFKSNLEKKFVYNHPFVLYEKSEVITSLLNKYQTYLPPRSRLIDITEKKKDIQDLLGQNANVGAIEEYVWKLLYDSIRPDDIENVCVWQSYQHDEHNQCKSYNIALTPHAEGWKQRMEEKESGLAQYLEPLSSNAQKKLPNFTDTLETYIESGITDIVKYKLFESAFTEVLVIDERIQRFTEDYYRAEGNRISNKQIYDYTNIIIPAWRTIQLDADNFTAELIEKIEKFINDHIKSCKFMLVHYSILERMYGSINTINEKLIEWSKTLRVVVTSGRGKPAELPSDHVCFINLSPVLNVFVEMRSKYAINYLLHSARR